MDWNGKIAETFVNTGKNGIFKDNVQIVKLLQ